jgi:hypothetical protein
VAAQTCIGGVASAPWSTCRRELDEVRTAEVIGSFCLATDLAMGLPFEHGLQSTLVAIRLAERMGVDAAAAKQTYYGCLLVWAGCTTDAEASSALFADGALLKYFNPVMFGSPAETLAGIMKALADPDSPPLVRARCRVPPGSLARSAVISGTSWPCARSPRCSARDSVSTLDRANPHEISGARSDAE